MQYFAFPDEESTGSHYLVRTCEGCFHQLQKIRPIFKPLCKYKVLGTS